MTVSCTGCSPGTPGYANRLPATKSTAIVSSVPKSTPCTYHGALIPKAASNSWVWFVIVRLVLQGWLPHSAATSPAPAYLPNARQVFASPGLRPHLTRQSTHSRFERGGIVLLGPSFFNHEITPKPAGHDSIVRHIAFFLCSGRTVSTRQLTASSLVEMRLLDLSFVR